jgi:hypothetical protein
MVANLLCRPFFLKIATLGLFPGFWSKCLILGILAMPVPNDLSKRSLGQIITNLRFWSIIVKHARIRIIDTSNRQRLQNLYESDESSIDDHHLIEKVFMIAIKIISINKILILFL